MKAAPFAYVRPGTVAEAVTALAEEDAKVIAGGQSLAPLLAMRLARPSVLVDINAIEVLRDLVVTTDSVTVSASVSQRRVLRDAEATRWVPLLRLALPWVGHRELRSRGTVCGSLAHADPAAELPAVACCLDATMSISGPTGQRTVRAGDFFNGPMTTDLRPDELLTSVTFPHAHSQEGFGFAEVARRYGDFALAGVATSVDAADQGPPRARITAFGVSDTPVTVDASDLLAEVADPDDPLTDQAELTRRLTGPCEDLAQRLVTTSGDQHGSRAYRRHILATLAAQEVAHAYLSASQDTNPQEVRP